MLKIKDNVDLKELIWRHDFSVRDKSDNYVVKKVYLANDDDDKNFYQINPITKIIELTRLDVS